MHKPIPFILACLLFMLGLLNAQGQSATPSPTPPYACGASPCAEDIAAWLAHLRPPAGFSVSYVGRFNGQVQQIAQDSQGRIFATVLEGGTLYGGVHLLLEDGTSAPVSPVFTHPIGLAFQPETDALYVTARLDVLSGGVLWRVLPDGGADIVRDDLPCCYLEIANQPSALAFGQDGLLYIGIGAVTDKQEPPDPIRMAVAPLLPHEASISRLNLSTGELTTYARGIRNAYDLVQAPDGTWYASDIGMVNGIGDRLLRVEQDADYGWPSYRPRGCEECPPRLNPAPVSPDLLSLPPYSLPRGVALAPQAWPAPWGGALFAALWNAGTVVAFPPNDPALSNADATMPYRAPAFLSGLLKPSDVLFEADGSLLIADWLYGHVWRVRYTGEAPMPSATPAAPPSAGFSSPTPAATRPSGFATNTPGP